MSALQTQWGSLDQKTREKNTLQHVQRAPPDDILRQRGGPMTGGALAARAMPEEADADKRRRPGGGVRDSHPFRGVPLEKAVPPLPPPPAIVPPPPGVWDAWDDGKEVRQGAGAADDCGRSDHDCGVHGRGGAGRGTGAGAGVRASGDRGLWGAEGAMPAGMAGGVSDESPDIDSEDEEGGSVEYLPQNLQGVPCGRVEVTAVEGGVARGDGDGPAEATRLDKPMVGDSLSRPCPVSASPSQSRADGRKEMRGGLGGALSEEDAAGRGDGGGVIGEEEVGLAEGGGEDGLDEADILDKTLMDSFAVQVLFLWVTDDV